MSYDRSYDSFVKPSPAFVHDFGLRIIKTRTLRKLQFKCSLLRILSRLNNLTQKSQRFIDILEETMIYQTLTKTTNLDTYTCIYSVEVLK